MSRLFPLAALLAITVSVRADADGDAFFNAKVLPLLKTHCYSCHSHESGKSKGGLVVDSAAGLRKGGVSGPALVPGNPDKSRLVLAIRRRDPDTAMPPKGPLADGDRKVLEEWVKIGAPDTRKGAAIDPFQEIMAKAKSHWSLQQVAKPEPPKGADGWQRNEIDDFVAAERKRAGLSPAPDATPRDLARRLSFDLIGLPPEPERVRKFEVDYAADPDAAVTGLVDDLLASPHYGERWGRHWLDLARYADESGGPANRARETRLLNAFTYRDYVIRAFNRDEPFDRFIVKQLAGDQIKLEDRRDLAAMGFLAIGSHQGMAAEVRAERLDTVGRVFLGLTIGCARCHDHKFDPISTEDYYALEGVILSTREVGAPKPRDPVGDLAECPVVAEEADPKRLAEREKAVAAATKAIADYEEELWGPTEPKWRALTPAVFKVLTTDPKEFGPLGERDYLRRNDIPPVLVQGWRKYLQDEERFRRRATHPVFDPWFKLAGVAPKEFATRAKSLIDGYTDKAGINSYLLAAVRSRPPESMADLAETYAKLLMDVDREWQANPKRPALPDEGREQLRQVLYAAGSPTVRSGANWRNAFGNVADRKRNELLAKLNDALYAHPAAPQRAMVLKDVAPRDANVLIRGEADQPGNAVRRGFLTVLGTDGKRQEFARNRSGRLELAEAIASNNNPLTARVLVNRVWGLHFGRPLVESTDNFGLQAAEPRHRALLDWLAATFVEDGWSLKKLHRRILFSRTYRQSATDHPDFAKHAAADPDNALLWRANIRRLSFEPTRDAVLAACGTLDATVGGRSVEVVDDPACRRRTVYARIDRPVQPLLSTFDVPDNQTAGTDRSATTSAGQALYLMNGGLLDRHAAALVKSDAFRRRASATERVVWLYQRALQREPTRREADAAARFLAGREEDDRAWRDFIQALLMSNEFGHTF